MTADPYEIAWTGSAKQAMQRLPSKISLAAVEFVYGPIADNPHRVGKPLRFEFAGLHVARRGDYRIIYRITDVVTIVSIEHRSEAYR